MKKWSIIGINILLLILGVFLSLAYSNHLSRERTEITKDAFKSTVETMVQVSVEQLNMQQEHVNSWHDYINSESMTMTEAMDFLKRICTDENVQAQIIDPETFEGLSTKENVARAGDYSVSYEIYMNSLTDIFREMMSENKSDNYLYVTHVFLNPSDGMQVVAFGRGVTLKTDMGGEREYLLMRLIYLDKLREQWVFPTEYEDAEISLITMDGEYIVQSKSMKSENFYEFIRAYNNLTYPQKDELQEIMTGTSSGVMEYQNARGVDSYWAYAGLQGNFGNWMIIGYVPADSVNNYGTDWPLVLMVVGILLILFLIDGAYFLGMNKKLRISMEEAKEANQAKTRFLSSMSHDIRTPMNAIIGMTNIAKTQIDDKKRLRDCLDKITISSNHLLTLINDILDISRVESGKLILNPSVFSLSEMLENLQNIMRTQIAAKDLNFKLNRVHLAVDYLYADDLRLNQIFINILSNAVKYTPKGGSVTVTMQEEPLDENRVRLIYIVEDTGIGMDKKFLQTIFEPFTRVNDSRIDTIEGSGLGMTIVKQMVDAMNGSISVKSEPGVGSEFRVEIDMSAAGKPAEKNVRETDNGIGDNRADGTLPKAANAVSGENTAENGADGESDESGSAASKSNESETGEFAGVHLLIAEDNDLNWEIINELLSYCDITSDRAVNGQECVRMLTESEPDTYRAVLMDIQMPVMDGLEAARTIRASGNAYAQSIPIIAMTADAFAEDVRACLNAGMNSHVAKPIDMKLLLQELRKLL